MQSSFFSFRALSTSFGVAALASVLGGCAVDASSPAPAVDGTEAVGQSQEALSQGLTERLQALGAPAVEQLEALYASGTSDGVLPEGRAQGRAFFLGLPGFTQLEDAIAKAGLPVASRLAEDFLANAIWHGKTFHAVKDDPTRIGMLTNDILGFQLATADIRAIGESDNPDEAHTIYLDYSHSNMVVVRGVQDYIRKIGPGLYIGKAFLKVPGADRRELACFFALDFGAPDAKRP